MTINMDLGKIKIVPFNLHEWATWHVTVRLKRTIFFLQRYRVLFNNAFFYIEKCLICSHSLAYCRFLGKNTNKIIRLYLQNDGWKFVCGSSRCWFVRNVLGCLYDVCGLDCGSFACVIHKRGRSVVGLGYVFNTCWLMFCVLCYVINARG